MERLNISDCADMLGLDTLQCKLFKEILQGRWSCSASDPPAGMTEVLTYIALVPIYDALITFVVLVLVIDSDVHRTYFERHMAVDGGRSLRHKRYMMPRDLRLASLMRVQHGTRMGLQPASLRPQCSASAKLACNLRVLGATVPCQAVGVEYRGRAVQRR